MQTPTLDAAGIIRLSKPLAVRRPLERARHLPGDFYASPEIYALEMERIFGRSWMCVAREEELRAPGDYMALDVAGRPVIVVRDASGKIVAMRNRCAHRGVEVAFGSGSTRHFTCPYHAWSFDLNGRLTGAGYMGRADFDPTNCRLPEVRTASWRGWVFVNLSPQAPEFDEFIAPFERPLWFYRSERTRLAGKVEVEVRTNWKFVAENLLDMYHVGTLHSKTFGQFLRLLRDDLPFEALPGGVAFTYGARPLTSDGSQTLPTLPFLADQDSGIAGKGGIFPNMNLSMRIDSLRMWTMWPLAPDRTRVTVYMLVHEDAPDTPGFEAKMADFADYMRGIVAEDRAAVESLQRNASAADFEPGPMSHLEGPIHHLLNHYADVLGLPRDAGDDEETR